MTDAALLAVDAMERQAAPIYVSCFAAKQTATAQCAEEEKQNRQLFYPRWIPGSSLYL